jgi:hypothetical protein
MRLRHLAFLLSFCPALAHADDFDGKPDLSSDDRATIEADRDAARKSVNEKYKGDDSADGRRERQKALREADQQVLEKKGLSERDYLWKSSHDAPSTQRDIKEKKKEIESKRKADAEAAKKEAPAASGEPEVVKGFSNDKPLDLASEGKPAKPAALDESGNPLPTVEKASGEGAAAPQSAPPPPSQHKSGKRHRGY